MVTEPILLDTSIDEQTGIESITVSGEGVLVWDPKSDIHLRLRYLLIKDGGRVDIGSDDCRYERKTSITLYGEINKNNEIRIPTAPYQKSVKIVLTDLLPSLTLIIMGTELGAF